MKRTFAYGAATNQGRWPVQEDGFYADPVRGLFALADGFGGQGKGDIAAKVALEGCRELEKEPTAQEGSGLSPQQVWERDSLLAAQKKLKQWNEKRGAGSRGGCSLLLARIGAGREVALTGSGACAALLWRAGEWSTLLLPQSSPRVPSLPRFPMQALGLRAEPLMESRAFVWRPGDLVFLFSSGVPWEDATYQAELSAQVALRMPGSELGSLATFAVGTAALEESPFNQTALVIEATA